MDALWQFESGINIFFQQLGAWLLLPMKGVSFLGQAEFFLLVIPVFYWCFDSRNGLRLGLMLMLTSSVNSWLKLVFHHPRPYWFDSRINAFATEPDFGMPSGHAQSAVAMWGFLARIYYQTRWLIPVAIGVILLTGVSRIYLGVHFADQVLAGWLVGALLLWVFTSLEPGVMRLVRKLSLFQLISVIVVISFGMIGLTYLLINAGRPVNESWQVTALAAAPDSPIEPLDESRMITLAGTWLGLAGGAAWDWRKNGQPSTRGPLDQKLKRYLLGLIGLVVFYFGLKLVLPATLDFWGQLLRYLRYALVGLWITLLAPALFRRMRLV